MSYTITKRRLSTDEANRLKKSGKLTADHFAWVLSPILAAGSIGFVLGKFATWAVLKFHGPAINALPLTLASCFALVGIIPAVWLYRSFTRRKRALLCDAANNEVEIIQVENAEIIQQEEYNDEGPIFYFGIDPDHVLFVWGQWMYHQSTYSANDRSTTEPEDKDWPPFPCRSFVLHRVPDSGEVLSIQSTSEKVKPDRILRWEDVPLQGLRDSLLLEGKLSDLKTVMQEAMHAFTATSSQVG